MITNKEKKIAFIKSIDPRIVLPLEDDLWEYYLDGTELDYGYKTSWLKFQDFIKNDYKDSVESYVEEKKKINILFNTISKTFKTYPIIKKDDMDETLLKILTEPNNKKEEGYYITIDLKDAILQCIKYFKIFDDEGIIGLFKTHSFNENILNFRGNKINICSILFNRTNDNFFWTLCSFLLNKIYISEHILLRKIKEFNLSLVNIKGDELLFYIGKENTLPQDFIDNFCNKDFIINGIECHVKLLYYNYYSYKINNEEKNISYFDNVITKQRKYGVKNCYYIWVLNKLYNDEPLIDKDLITVGNHYKTVPLLDKITILKNNV